MVAAAAAKSLQSCPTLCDPIDSSPSGSRVPGRAAIQIQISSFHHTLAVNEWASLLLQPHTHYSDISPSAAVSETISHHHHHHHQLLVLSVLGCVSCISYWSKQWLRIKDSQLSNSFTISFSLDETLNMQGELIQCTHLSPLDKPLNLLNFYFFMFEFDLLLGHF